MNYTDYYLVAVLAPVLSLPVVFYGSNLTRRRKAPPVDHRHYWYAALSSIGLGVVVFAAVWLFGALEVGFARQWPAATWTLCSTAFTLLAGVHSIGVATILRGGPYGHAVAFCASQWIYDWFALSTTLALGVFTWGV